MALIMHNAETGDGESLSLVVTGLSTHAVQERIKRGEVNTSPEYTGKTVADIFRTNIFTRINALLGVLFILVLTTGSWINCAFGLLIAVNSSIGIIQELRAKRTLDSLSVLSAEPANVLRDGQIVQLSQEELVLGDVIAVKSGQQIALDGKVCISNSLSVNESLLTGESDPVIKEIGSRLLSGSFVSSGSGYYTVTDVGADSYAAKLTSQARTYTFSASPLQKSIDKILQIITFILIPVAGATIFSQITSGSTSYNQTVLAITGALVPMIPEGLVLITSTAFALGVIRLGKRKCLVQELPAIEGLARVDVVCADKTGTLTEGTLHYSGIETLSTISNSECELILSHIVHCDDDPNATAAAIKSALPQPSSLWEVSSSIPFSSARKWAATVFADHGTWIMGAPDVLSSADSPAGMRAAKLSSRGMRVLMLAHAPHPLSDNVAPDELPKLLEPSALVFIDQKIRDDAQATLEYFTNQDVSLKVISGDNPASVAAVTEKLGITDDEPVDARNLPDPTRAEFGEIIESHCVFGRVHPEQKQQMVTALQSLGHTVAMTGDGVNDVLALKKADIGVAMGSGSSAARAAAKIVLLDNRFATLPHVVAEGRRVIGNIERVASLFLTKTTYSALCAILVIATNVPFPFQPIHVTITGWFTIGLPAFILSLPPNNARAKPGFTRRVLGFALPSGVVIALSSFLTYMMVSDWRVPNEHTQESTAALLALIIPSVWVLACAARPWNPWKIALFLTPIIGYWLIFTLPITQHFFILDSSNKAMMLTALFIGMLGACLVELIWHVIGKRLSAHIRS